MIRHVFSPSFTNNRMLLVIAAVVLAAPGVLCSGDSLRSALEAISDSIGDTPRPRMVYLNSDYGQPEDIGYGYQKNLRNFENIFEQGAPPPISNTISKADMVQAFLNYLAKERPRFYQKPWSKRSIFREREVSDMSDDLQQLNYDRYATPSAFRERYKTNPGIVQEHKNNMEDQDNNYMTAINSLVDNYIEDNVQGMSDEELEDYIRFAQEEKRNVPEAYRSLYDPYNKRGGNKPSTKRQYFIIPKYPNRRNNKYENLWVKPRLMKRSKKNISSNELHTDPKVAAELNNIFLGSEPNNNLNASTTNTSINNNNKYNGNNTSKLVDENNYSKIELKKKSIDWSNYFGYDRKKKSIENIPSDDTILNQYMYTYGKENELENEVNEVNNDLKDDKLVWLEDKLIDNALKYTGANQGTKDPEEIDNVKNQVLANLNQAYNIEKLRQENNNEMQENNNSQPMNSLGIEDPQTDVEHKQCSQLLQVTQDCLELGGSAGELMLPICTLYRVCNTCESENPECVDKFIQGSHELCSKAPLCRYFSRRMLQLMQDRPLQMECHECMINFLQNED